MVILKKRLFCSIMSTFYRFSFVQDDDELDNGFESPFMAAPNRPKTLHEPMNKHDDMGYAAGQAVTIQKINGSVEYGFILGKALGEDGLMFISQENAKEDLSKNRTIQTSDIKLFHDTGIKGENRTNKQSWWDLIREGSLLKHNVTGTEYRVINPSYYTKMQPTQPNSNISINGVFKTIVIRKHIDDPFMCVNKNLYRQIFE